MTAHSDGKSRKLNKILFFLLLIIISVVIGFGMFQKKRWNVPPSAQELKNPLSPTEANLAAARQIYKNRCENCHGETGAGDGPDAMMYDPSPADLTNVSDMKKTTDGQIYYQITEGKKPMPAYKNRLSDEQRWQLVLLVRTFAQHPASAKPADGKTQAPAVK